MSSFYKFIDNNLDVIHSLIGGSIKFTPIPELNDPSELVPNLDIDEIKASLQYLRQHGYSEQDMIYLRQQGNLLQRLAPEVMVIGIPATQEQASQVIRLPFFNDIQNLEPQLYRTATAISSNVGIFCLSQRYDSLPMWAHYAANAKGFVVEFLESELKNEFLGDNTGVLNQLIPVRYGQEISGVTFDPKSHESLFFDKFQDWQYEQEVRIIKPLKECNKVEYKKTECQETGIIYLHQLPFTCIGRVILGWNISPEHRNAVVDYVHSLDSPVEVVQARFSIRTGVELMSLND
ncbi:DUF2971 domain-containing protein [Methylovulum psychrotolerans]|nr:DUF2971 domain-containing protein [Methylovulum psychrotolerans]POZ50912.1 hypothetical protein AADEFJLK_03384 [Methylovulum psychrotolerans]